MNFNQKLWLEQIEKQELAKKLQTIFKEHTLPTNNIYFGGFSSGGNVALLISDFLTQENTDIMPKGVFIVDSPIDLAALYYSSLKNLERNFSEPSVQESTWIVETLGNQFGIPDKDISKYQEYAIYTSKTDHTDNIKALKNTKMRLYTEPDTLWWKTNRMANYDQMNAYYIKKLSETLMQLNFKDVQYIPTVNKGYRANGDRHPHSWAIVDKKDLIDWMLVK
jgi:predicted alpha/beta-fold hydrolase